MEVFIERAGDGSEKDVVGEGGDTERKMERASRKGKVERGGAGRRQQRERTNTKRRDGRREREHYF